MPIGNPLELIAVLIPACIAIVWFGRKGKKTPLAILIILFLVGCVIQVASALDEFSNVGNREFVMFFCVFAIFFWLIMYITVVTACQTTVKTYFHIGNNQTKNGGNKSQKGRDSTKPSAKPSNQGVGHVPTIGPDIKKKLEQLDALKNAGMIGQEEYEEKLKKILQ